MQVFSRRLVGAARNECGQVFVLMAISMVGICGVAGFAIDTASWYQAHRAQQAVADASALAAAADLPADTSQATSDAQAYAIKNGASAADITVTFSTTYTVNDTVTVRSATTAPSYFLKALGIGSASVSATAKATAMPLTTAFGSGPFAVHYLQPQLSGPGCPCYGVGTTLQLDKVGPGGFKIVNVDGSTGGTGPSTLVNWILNGCNCSTATPTWLSSDPGVKFNSSQVKDALDQRLGKILLFPVYDVVSGGGSGLQYHVIAFVGFRLTGYDLKGSSGSLTGSFEKVSWRGSGTGSSPGDYTATTVQLTG